MGINQKIVKWFSCSLIGLMLFACAQNNHLIKNSEQREAIHQQFLKQQELAKGRQKELFSVFNQSLTAQEREGLEFLYAFMPLSDLANYDGPFYLTQVQYALKTKTAFAWGNSVPDNIFLHFVLPYRINNENLDSSRVVFFNELKDRISGMTMSQAALEVNHWCHEKVSYQGTDIRTSAPLSTIRSAFGRCGEESTFTVTAMRAVGIPARQIYTPRWAHSDDNHAWVEVWTDGKWSFLGACEPEPELNIGWFAGPATRAMLLHTRVYGQYHGSEDVVHYDERYTELNVIPAYAPAKRVYVKVTDKQNQIVKDANVEFQLYNYAEFYPIAKCKTDSTGHCNLLTGLGELIVWASKNSEVGYKKLTVKDCDTLSIQLGAYNYTNVVEELKLTPPSLGTIAVASEDGRKLNTLRVQQEDSIRNAYEKTFIDSVQILKVSNDLNFDFHRLQKIFKQSAGNWKVTSDFLYWSKDKNLEKALVLLEVVSDKDRRDTPLEVYQDHFLNTEAKSDFDAEIYNAYILNPRIDNELITPYKSTFQQYFTNNFITSTRDDISTLMTWINDSIQILDDANTSRTPIFPSKLLELKVSDKQSRDIFFVAASRSFGIPARLEVSRRIPQIYKEGEWKDISFESLKATTSSQGSLTLNWDSSKGTVKPEYYLHFTIGKFNGSTFKTLDFEFSDLFKNYPASLKLDTGKYELITGNRQTDGSVYVRRLFFDVKENVTTTLSLVIAQPQTAEVQKKNKANLELTFNNLNSNTSFNMLQTKGEGAVVLAWIDPDREPTKHFINDLIRLKANYEAWSGKIFLIIPAEKLTFGLTSDKLKSLPKNVVVCVDNNRQLQQFYKSENNSPLSLPALFVIDGSSEIQYQSFGYRIGLGDEVLSTINVTCRIH